MIFVFLTSGLFLGWSLGANDAANVFGTAVGSKMIRFKTAAIIASIFVVIGAVVGGSGAAHTLGKLGAVNAIAGSFMVAFAAGFTVFWMTKLHLPVSTSQAVVGAIIGWNFFSGSLTDGGSLTKIISTWVICPLLSGVIAILLFSLFKAYFNRVNIHMLRIDSYTRIGLIVVGAFGAYSLGANNIANVMGVFVPVAPFPSVEILGLFTLNSTQILFLIGGLAIAVGIITYSSKVMDTVGGSLMKISPVIALVVVLSQAIVLFLFSSVALENWLVSRGLPSIPLVPVSSSQAVIGAVIGVGLVKGGKGIRFNVLGEIATGWVTTPIIAGVISFVALFFLQNVFDQQVYQKMTFSVTDEVAQHLQNNNISRTDLDAILNAEFHSSISLDAALKQAGNLDEKQRAQIIESSLQEKFQVDSLVLVTKVDAAWLGSERYAAVHQLTGKTFGYKWQFSEALVAIEPAWALKEKTKLNKVYNKSIQEKRIHLFKIFKLTQE